MMCACIGGLVPAFAGKVGKPVRVAKANTGGQTMRNDSALGQPLAPERAIAPPGPARVWAKPMPSAGRAWFLRKVYPYV